MDKHSLKVLKFIAKADGAAPRNAIIDRFGESSRRSINFLSTEGYITSGRTIAGAGPVGRPVFVSDGKFTVTSKGLAYLEAHPFIVFDQWLTRILAIWGAITGTIALFLELT